MTKEELKPNMYVRFKDKRNIEYIRKITEIPKDNRYASIYLDQEANYSNGLSPKNIIKVSYNLIDLIEVGDYANGIKVDFTNINNKLSYEDICIGFYDGDGDIILFEKDVKSIVTKEQFEEMQYVIK